MPEKVDRELFDRIAFDYSKKDLYTLSRSARKFQLESLVNLISGTRFDHILDVGCGPGFNSEYLKGRFTNYTGVDYSTKFIELARDIHPNVKFIEGNIKNLDFLKNDKFDLILGVGILHHIDNVDDALQSIRRIANHETVLAFIEPYNGNPLVQLLRLVRKKIDPSYSDSQTFFSREKLKFIFKQNGFKIELLKYQGYFSPPFAQVILKPMVLFKPICALAILIDKFIQNRLNNPLSWNIIWTARKISD